MELIKKYFKAAIIFFGMSPIYNIFYIKLSILLIVLLLISLKSSIHFLLNNKKLIIISTIYLFTCVICSIYNSTVIPILYCFFYIITLLVVLNTSLFDARSIVGFSTKVMFFIIITSFIGSLYYLIGGKPIYSLDTIYLYLSTFSKGSEGLFLRPSGIYDEPGALTFFICALVIARCMLGLSNYTNVLLLIGGLISQSIIQILFIPFYLIWLIFFDLNFKMRKLSSLLIFILMIVFIILIVYFNYLDWAVDRFIFYINDPITIPRYRGLEIIFENVNYNFNALFFGYDQNCINRTISCNSDIVGENFLTPLIYGGLMVAWPYYFFLFFAPFIFFRFFPLFMGLNMMLLQRPYLLEFSYSATISFIILIGIYYKSHKNES